MRTEMSREIGGEKLFAAATAGAICDMSDRFGDFERFNLGRRLWSPRPIRRLVSGDPRFVREALICMVRAGGVGATDAEESVDRAIEGGGWDAATEFVAKLLNHAWKKASDAAGKPEPDQ